MYGSEAEKESAKNQNLVAIIELQCQFLKTTFSCESSPKRWRLRMWNGSFRARPPWKADIWRCENEVFVRMSSKAQRWRCENEAKQGFRANPPLKNWKFNMWKEFAEKLSFKLKDAKIKFSVQNPREDAIVSGSLFCAARGLARMTLLILFIKH